MIITIGKPYAVSERGGRPNNEDSVYPLPEDLSGASRLFMVCDGVGGAEKGEVASSLACESMETYFSTFLKDRLTPDFVQKAIHYTEACFDTYVREHPEAKGMATTLALAYMDSDGITFAHVGDSRIYYLRQGEILYRSEDHSLVNLWVSLGKITPEEAATHPQRNVIVRAIEGSHSSTEADVNRWTDVRAGDFVFLCTDGLLEQWSDKEIADLFNHDQSAQMIKDRLLERCDGATKDNFSFYIIPIQKAQENTGVRQNILSFLYSFA